MYSNEQHRVTLHRSNMGAKRLLNVIRISARFQVSKIRATKGTKVQGNENRFIYLFSLQRLSRSGCTVEFCKTVIYHAFTLTKG